MCCLGPGESEASSSERGEASCGGEGTAAVVKAVPARVAKESYQYGYGQEEEPRRARRVRVLLFWVCALGYMAPWTFIGSLIAYFKTSRDANFYVELYAVYYATGMPTSMLQEWYDSYWDMKLGSSWTYLVRGQLNFLAIILAVVAVPAVLLNRVAMIAVMAVLGVSSWMLHGTACMLASMTSTGAISALQTGFRTPEIIAVLACYYLDIGSEASRDSLRLFFLAIALLAVSGLVAWTSLVLSPKIRRTLAEKDRSMHDLAARAPLLLETDADRPPLGGALSLSEMEHVAQHIRPCRVALFWTMFGSIFTAAFFAYATSSSGVDIEQVLYFTRLFGDLLGRPFTSLPRPFFLKTGHHLAVFAIARLLFSLVYFLYVFLPNLPRSDVFVVADIAVFSLTSGYVGIISYEYAARDFKTAAAKTYAATLMNTTFQLSMFLAVALGILISELIS
mmetsp:Transcript_17593/g.55012  ORF Transcript_17593/g.55012 Transcript_17593/m.55012 type:complete len:450 (-) Transcript_17593:1784-3133(-)